MKYVVSFWIVLLIQSSIISAQSDSSYYLSKDGIKCAKEIAHSYVKAQLIDSAAQLYSFQEYSVDGILISRGSYLRNDFSLKTSSYTEYFKNGNRKVRGTYFSDVSVNEVGVNKVNVQVSKSVQINSWYYWYENGSIKLEMLHALDTIKNSFNSFIINFWDTAGIKKVIDGNGDYSFEEEYLLDHDSMVKVTFSGSVKYGRFDGIWKGFYSDGTLFCEETYNEEGLIEGKSYDLLGKSYTYTKLEVTPEFRGGNVELIRFLQKNIEYPHFERIENIEGKVMIRFVVDTSGKVKDPRVTLSVSPGLDQEALRVVKKLPDFKPGIVRGRAVNFHFNLPVVYKLQ